MDKFLSSNNLEFIVKFLEKDLRRVNGNKAFPFEWIKVLSVMCTPGGEADQHS